MVWSSSLALIDTIDIFDKVPVSFSQAFSLWTQRFYLSSTQATNQLVGYFLQPSCSHLSIFRIPLLADLPLYSQLMPKGQPPKRFALFSTSPAPKFCTMGNDSQTLPYFNLHLRFSISSVLFVSGHCRYQQAVSCFGTRCSDSRVFWEGTIFL